MTRFSFYLQAFHDLFTKSEAVRTFILVVGAFVLLSVIIVFGIIQSQNNKEQLHIIKMQTEILKMQLDSFKKSDIKRTNYKPQKSN